jgi:O-antigen ligase
MFILLITTVDDEKKLKQILLFFFVSLFIYQFHSFIEFLNGRYEYRMKTVRMNSVNKTHGDPNTFAGMLLYAMPFLVPFWATARGGKTRWLIAGHVLLSLLCIYLTGSRRAYIGVFFLSALLAYRSPHRWSLLAAMAVIGPLGFMVMRDDLQTRLLTIFDSSVGPSNAATSAQFRWKAMVEGIALFQKYPFTGTGPATFATASGCELQAHNVYAQTLSEMGLLGVLSLVSMVVCFWLNARETDRIYRAHPWWEKDFVYQTGRIGWMAAVLLLFMGAGGHNLFRFNWLWFGAFQVCAVHAARQRARREAEAAHWYEPEPAVEVEQYEYAT